MYVYIYKYTHRHIMKCIMIWGLTVLVVNIMGLEDLTGIMSCRYNFDGDMGLLLALCIHDSIRI